jgi:hypothetical protein
VGHAASHSEQPLHVTLSTTIAPFAFAIFLNILSKTTLNQPNTTNL